MSIPQAVAVLSVLTLASLPLARPFPPPSEDVLSAAHLEHLQRLQWFHCFTPQPRSISVSQLFEETERRHKAYYPDTTVLHRCDLGSGCCMLGGYCGPVRHEVATLPFKVTYLEDHGPHKRGSWNMEFHHFHNHTECGCVTEERAWEFNKWQTPH